MHSLWPTKIHHLCQNQDKRIFSEADENKSNQKGLDISLQTQTVWKKDRTWPKAKTPKQKEQFQNS
jgi:hypothetical protein